MIKKEEKMIKNRTLSFIIIAIVYVLATAGGVLTYIALPFEPWLSLLIADIVATAITFVFSVIFKNASVYDPYWSVQPIVILTAFFIYESVTIINVLLLVVVYIWGVRLTANWAYTFKNLEHQDWRYTKYQNMTKKFYPIVNFFGIHLMPTLIVYACTLPCVFVMQNGLDGNVFSYIFLAISLSAVILQGTADYQIHKFIKNKNGQNFITSGLWKYSRHPNYLGEILMWWGVGLACVSILPSMWYLLAGAVVNTLLFLFISIPLADGKQAQKQGFEEYKNSTRMLLPIKRFKKN